MKESLMTTSTSCYSGETLTHYRDRTGFPRTRLAYLLGISPRSLGRWEARGGVILRSLSMKEYQMSQVQENEEFLSSQLITYLGNKRTLVPLISEGLEMVKLRLRKEKIVSLDLFSGSGVVARLFKQSSSLVIANDLEGYSKVINSCYLTNMGVVPKELKSYFDSIRQGAASSVKPGFFRELYSPQDMEKVQQGERCFYTPRNAEYLDTVRQLIDQAPAELQNFFLAPLLAEASVHVNTSGVFKGFYKNMEGVGQFGGTARNALQRICSNIELNFPVFSNFECDSEVYQQDANQLVDSLGEVDVAYLDPPYNQHPYGSNYFMLNLLVEYHKPQVISKVSGIPKGWNRSNYNKKTEALKSLKELVEKTKAKFLMISFSDDGFISKEEMVRMLSPIGALTILNKKYNTFRGGKNLNARDTHVMEYLYIVEKS